MEGPKVDCVKLLVNYESNKLLFPTLRLCVPIAENKTSVSHFERKFLTSDGHHYPLPMWPCDAVIPTPPHSLFSLRQGNPPYMGDTDSPTKIDRKTYGLIRQAAVIALVDRILSQLLHISLCKTRFNLPNCLFVFPGRFRFVVCRFDSAWPLRSWMFIEQSLDSHNCYDWRLCCFNDARSTRFMAFTFYFVFGICFDGCFMFRSQSRKSWRKGRKLSSVIL